MDAVAPSGYTNREAVEPRRSNIGNSSLVLQAVRNWKFLRSKTFVAVAILWFLGLSAMFLAPAPVKVTEEMWKRYEAKLDEAIAYTRQNANSTTWLDAVAERRQAQTWFWRFTAQRQSVLEKKEKERAAYDIVQGHERHIQSLLSDAKAELGLWSDLGLEEGRRLFWSSFDAGKVFGRRQTMWDMAFNLLAGSQGERNLITTFVQLICTAIVNFTAGMLTSIFIFIFQLPWLMMSYQASWPSMLAFFSIAALGGISVIVSYLLGLYLAGATAIYASLALTPYLRLGAGEGQTRAYLDHRHED